MSRQLAEATARQGAQRGRGAACGRVGWAGPGGGRAARAWPVACVAARMHFAAKASMCVPFSPAFISAPPACAAGELANELAAKQRRLQALYEKQGRSAQVRGREGGQAWGWSGAAARCCGSAAGRPCCTFRQP